MKNKLNKWIKQNWKSVFFAFMLGIPFSFYANTHREPIPVVNEPIPFSELYKPSTDYEVEVPESTMEEVKDVVIVPSDSVIVEEPAPLISLGEFRLTAYCSCEECCGVWAECRPVDEDGNEIVIGDSGEVLEVGKSIAVDPEVIPYGTRVYIYGHEYIAQDCGGAIKGNRVDIYFENHEETVEFGIRYAEVFVEGGEW